MTQIEAIKLVAQFIDIREDHPNTCYGGNSNVQTCKVCKSYLNVHPFAHAPNCQAIEAFKLINDLIGGHRALEYQINLEQRMKEHLEQLRIEDERERD